MNKDHLFLTFNLSSPCYLYRVVSQSWFLTPIMTDKMKLSEKPLFNKHQLDKVTQMFLIMLQWTFNIWSDMVLNPQQAEILDILYLNKSDRHPVMFRWLHGYSN